MTIRLGQQWADQLGHLGPGQAERGRKLALRQRRFRAVAGVKVRLDDRLLGRRRHAMRTLARRDPTTPATIWSLLIPVGCGLDSG